MKNEIQNKTYAIETTADNTQTGFRDQLTEMFNNVPMSDKDLLFNLGLFIRGSLLVKYLVLNSVYERVKHLPGVMMEFGVWYGQNLVLLENLRAIHEPFNKQRHFIGFDTFSGYTKPSDKDKNSEAWIQDSYNSNKTYVAYLEELLKIHEGSNVLGHIRGQHKLVAGDVTKTTPAYFAKHPETIVAFAFFDIGLYEPTKVALQLVVDHSVPGTMILLDELTWAEAPGEALAFKEVFTGRKYKIEKVEHYPSKSLVTIL